ncbi:MAG TPA: amidohydrolase family protein [Pirellulales bacterium]|nr:amidohydrolase family protein [Pirellulales bacterium]
MEIIDGYTHCGTSKYEPIERAREVMAAAGVRRAVLVQHLGEFDNSYLGRIASADPEHFAAVCLVNHESADCGETLRRWAATGGFKGIRLTIDVFSAKPELAATAVELGLIIVLFAPRGVAGALGPLASFLDRHSQARLVVTHMGNPDMTNLARVASSDDVFHLADYPNVYFQISGMGMFIAWPHEPLYALIERAFERFGAPRLYWGSNFPVVGGQSDYQSDLALVLDHKLPVPEAAVPAIAGSNAKRLWFPGIP